MRKFIHIEDDGSISDIASPCLCSFGILESIGAAITSFLATDIGVGAATSGIIGTAAADALAGGVVGAITDPKNPLKGAEFGSIAGGVGGLAAPALADFGLGGVAGAGLSGALGGGVAGLATGRNPLTSALEGGATAAIGNALGVGSPSGGTATTGGPGASVASTAAPASVPASAGGGGTGDISITGTGAGSGVGTGGNIDLIGADGPPQVPTGSLPAYGSGLTTGGVDPTGAASMAHAFGPSTTIGTSGGAPGAASMATALGPSTSTNGGIGDWLNNNRWAPGALMLGIDAIKGNQPMPGQKQLTANANALNTQGNQLASYARSGTLPPGMQLGINEATAAAEASIRSSYAAAGDSGSSAEMQDIAAVKERAAVQGSQIAIQLLQQGVSETNMADQLYLELMGQALQQDQQLGQALATFSSGLVGGGGNGSPTTYTLTPSKAG